MNPILLGEGGEGGRSSLEAIPNELWNRFQRKEGFDDGPGNALFEEHGLWKAAASTIAVD